MCHRQKPCKDPTEDDLLRATFVLLPPTSYIFCGTLREPFFTLFPFCKNNIPFDNQQETDRKDLPGS